MKKQLMIACTLCFLLALPAPAAEENTTTSETIDFGKFEATEEGTFVEIKVNSSLITMAAKLTKESEPEIARILSGLRSIRVNVMEFDNDNRKDIESRIRSIRGQLDNLHWEKVVSVKEDGEDVGIYVKMKGEESIEGVTVTVIDDGEAVLIHVDGSIRPEELATLGERFDLEPLMALKGVTQQDHEKD